MFLGYTSVEEIIGWSRENGAINWRIVGETKWMGTKKELVLNMLSLGAQWVSKWSSGKRYRLEIQSWESSIYRWYLKSGVWMKSPKKYVQKEKSRGPRAWDLESAVGATTFTGQHLDQWGCTRKGDKLRLTTFLNPFILSVSLNLIVLLESK